VALSIRNQFPGSVAAVLLGGVMSTVKVRLDGGAPDSGLEITAAVTAEAARELGLAEGVSVLVLFKSTEVSIALA
jgi:molybdate transport system regulatory protein